MPSVINTSAFMTRPVFKDFLVQHLLILTLVNVFNLLTHCMGEADIAN